MAALWFKNSARLLLFHACGRREEEGRISPSPTRGEEGEMAGRARPLVVKKNHMPPIAS